MKLLLLLILLIIPVETINTKQVNQVPIHEVIIHITIQEYISFKEKLGSLESSNRYEVVNQFGFMGKYQFGEDALKDVSITVSKEEFLNSKYLQELALYKYFIKNQEYLKNEIKEFVGKEINGIVITKSSLLAAAHFAGAGNVKRFLKTGYNRTDFNGATTVKYLKEFSSYTVSFIDDIEHYIQKVYT